MPPPVRKLIDRLAVKGPFVIDDARLTTWPEAAQGPTSIFEGKVGLRGAGATLGVPITEMDADLDLRVVTFADQPWPHTDIRMDARSLRASDREITRLSMRSETGDQPSVIKLYDLKGSIYGGTLIGRGQVQLESPGSFGFDMAIQEVALEPFLNPVEHADSAAGVRLTGPDVADEAGRGLTRDISSGLLSAGLSVRVPLEGGDPVQGRGAVLVRDARLYDKPLTLALLQAANFTLPNESSFDRASARYLIAGDEVVFDDIRFEAPAFVIAGSGRMGYPSTDLQLRMVTHNPIAPTFGPVTELVKTFKDQLLGIEVRGTLAAPEANVVPLEGVFRSWDRLFGQPARGVKQVGIEQPSQDD